MDVSQAIRKRKSVRAYLNKQVAAADMAKIIEAGRWAPNAGTFHISVVRNVEVQQRINDRALDSMVRSDSTFLQQRASLPGYQPLYGAPVLILFSAPSKTPFSAVNTALAAENMILEATSLGLGSCFLATPTLVLNGENGHGLAHEAGIPDGNEVLCALVIGYPAAEDPFTSGERKMKGSVHYVN